MKTWKSYLAAAAAIGSLGTAGSCSGPGIEVCSFGSLSDGRPVTLYRLTNASGASLEVCDYGARIVSIRVPDARGELDDVIVGCGTAEDFETGPDRFIGCVLGRYCNRIDGARITIDGREYLLDANETLDGRPVHCHGGYDGFDRKLWRAEPLREKHRTGVRMHYRSPDGEGGYPGNLDCRVTYWWSDDDICRVEYEATTDAPTVVNLSNHAYFNMKGRRAGYVMDQLLQVAADSCIQNNGRFCPDLVRPVEGSPFDFREPHRIDYRIDMPDEHLRIMRGMSACWKIAGWDGSLRHAASLYDRASGRGVEVLTTEPAFLIYTGRGFDGSVKGKYGPIEKFDGMVLETLHFADSPNQKRFPDTVLRPGERYRSVTEWRFFTKRCRRAASCGVAR